MGIPIIPFKLIQNENGKFEKHNLSSWKNWIENPQTKKDFNSLNWIEANAFAVLLGTKAKNGYYLSVVDYDTKGAVSEEVKIKGKEILRDFPITQFHQTVNDGLHYVYWSRKKPKTDGTFHDTAGLELLGEKKLCLMPPSLGYYCLNDNSPTTIDDLEEKFYVILKKHNFNKSEQMEIEQQIDVYSFNLKRIIDLSKLTKITSDKYRGSHPIHGSTTEKNFCVNTKANTWYCFRHNSGGGALQYLAVKEGIIKCEQAKKGALKRKIFRDVLQIAVSQGLIDQKILKQSEINPIILAKDLMEEYVFVVDQDTNDLFYYDKEEGIYCTKTEQLIKKEIAEKLDENFKSRYYNEINEFIKATASIVKMNHLNPEILAVKNGLLNVIIRDLKPFSPDVYVTNKLEVEYNPKIKYIGSYNPKFLDQVLDSQKQRSQIQELIGHCLYRKIITETSLVCLGKGSNGKSIFLTAIKTFLGQKNVSSHTIQQLCYDKFTIAELKGKLANICTDLPHKQLMNTGTYKALVSGDSVPIKIKHVQGKGETLDPYIKYLYSANHLPPIQNEEDCDAWYRRFIFADFKKKFTPENSIPRQKLLRKLSTPEEKSALLNWGLAGLARLHLNGDVSSKPCAEEIRKEYRRRSSTTLAYFDDQVKVTDSCEDWVFTDDWFQDYIIYCHKNRLNPKSRGAFLKDIEQYLPGVQKTKKRPKTDRNPISAWFFVKFVPCVPHVPHSRSLLAKNENISLDVFSVSGEKVAKHGTTGTCGTASDMIEYCWNTCRSYKNEGDYVCTHPNQASVNQKTVMPLKCPGFNPILRRS